MFKYTQIKSNKTAFEQVLENKRFSRLFNLTMKKVFTVKDTICVERDGWSLENERLIWWRSVRLTLTRMCNILGFRILISMIDIRLKKL